MNILNLFDNIPPHLPEELVETLAGAGPVRIERIVSRGQCSAPGFWYDQDQHEWVVLLKGHASLRFADCDEPLPLGPGDYLHISAHAKHRVESTSKTEDTVWLAVFY